MNPLHAVDVYIDLVTREISVCRRRDAQWWHSDGTAEARALGSVIREALDSKITRQHRWTTCDKDSTMVDTRRIVVVFRCDHHIVIGTPVTAWDKPDDIVLESPTPETLGEVVLRQAYASAQRSRRDE